MGIDFVGIPGKEKRGPGTVRARKWGLFPSKKEDLGKIDQKLNSNNLAGGILEDLGGFSQNWGSNRSAEDEMEI